MTTLVAAPPARRTWRRIGVAAQVAALALVLAALVLGRPGVLHSPLSYAVVSGHSMEPTLHTGDVVLVTRRAAYRVGDEIAYRVPAGGPGAGLVVVHRIVGGDARAGFLVRGDNKPFADPWRPRPEDIVGRVRFTVPKLGLVVGYTRSPVGLAALAALLTVMIALGGRKPAPPSSAGSLGRPQAP